MNHNFFLPDFPDLGKITTFSRYLFFLANVPIKFNIFSTDLRINLSDFVATGVYASFKKSFKIICNMHVQNEGGAKGRLNNVKKNTLLVLEV